MENVTLRHTHKMYFIFIRHGFFSDKIEVYNQIEAQGKEKSRYVFRVLPSIH